MKTRLQEFYDYIFGDLIDFNKQLVTYENELKENKKASDARLLAYTAKGGRFFDKKKKKESEAKEHKKSKSIADKIKEKEVTLNKNCLDFFKGLIKNQNEFRKLLRKLKKTQVEITLYGNNTDNLNRSVTLSSPRIPHYVPVLDLANLPPETKEQNIPHPHPINVVIDDNIPDDLSEPLTPVSDNPEDDKAVEEILAPPEVEGENRDDMEAGMLTPVFRNARVSRNYKHIRLDMPTDEKLQLIFQKWDEKFQYFNDSDLSFRLATEKFIHFYKICKLIGDGVESSSDIDIVSQAYKMVVLFGDQHDPNKYFNSIDGYLKKFFAREERPLHDALTFPIPVNGVPVCIDLKKWREIIKGKGPEAYEVFNRATEIEARLKRAPHSYAEAYQISKKLIYTHVDQFPLLADLCMSYNVSEALFDRCLSINENRKTSDNLPNISINGNDLGFPGYHLVKLPLDDPNAFILGYITKCCQSIGGDSENCVRDGIQRPNNGFYVLLKDRALLDSRIASESKPFKDDKIDYEKFEIVGQGYAWISAENNLVFDSWENARSAFYRNSDDKLMDLRDDEVIVPMLKHFSKRVVEKENSNILRVTIGTGGKTPHEFKSNTVTIPETILEGKQYADSFKQSLIYINTSLQDALFEDIQQQLKTIVSESKECVETSLSQLIMKEQIYSIQLANTIKNVLSNSFIKLCLLNKAEFDQITKLISVVGMQIWNVFSQLIQHNLLDKTIFDILSSEPLHIQKLTQGLINLKNHNLLNENTLQKVLLSFPGEADLVSSIWIELKQKGIIDELERLNLLTPERNQKLFHFASFPEYKKEIIEAILLLTKNDKLNGTNFDAVLKSPALSKAINFLHEAKLYDKYYEPIMQLDHYAPIVAQCLVIFQENKIVNEDYINKILIKPYSESRTLYGMIALHKEGILNRKFFNLLKEVSSHKREIDVAQALIELHHAHLLDNERAFENYKAYIMKLFDQLPFQYSKYVTECSSSIKPACQGWIALYKLSLLNNENCNIIQKISTKFPEKAEVLFQKLNEVIASKKEVSDLELSDRQKIFEQVVRADIHFAKLNLFKKIYVDKKDELDKFRSDFKHP